MNQSKSTNISIPALMAAVSSAAPAALVVCAALTFIVVGIFSYDYYHNLFSFRFPQAASPLAVLVAVVQELVRFTLLVASVRDFSEQRRVSGLLGLIGSIVLVWHDLYVARHVAQLWEESGSSGIGYSDMFTYLVLLGLLLEVRLILTSNAPPSNKVELEVVETPKDPQPSKEEIPAYQRSEESKDKPYDFTRSFDSDSNRTRNRKLFPNGSPINNKPFRRD